MEHVRGVNASPYRLRLVGETCIRGVRVVGADDARGVDAAAVSGGEGEAVKDSNGGGGEGGAEGEGEGSGYCGLLVGTSRRF